MWIKLCGAILVLISCGGIGFSVAGEMEKRIHQLQELRAIFLLQRGEIRYRHASLPEAFQSASGRCSKTFFPFFDGIYRALEDKVWDSFEMAYSEVEAKTLQQTALNLEDRDKLKQFARMVGDMDIKMQLDALDWYLEQSDQVLSELLPVAAKKEKVIKCIGVLTGIFLVVLLM